MPKVSLKKPARHSTITAFALIIGSVVLTTLARLALNPILGKKAFLIVYFPALVFGAWIGGWTGGIAALILSALAVTYFFLSPTPDLSITDHGDQLTLLIFILVGLCVCALSSAQSRAHQQAEQSAEDLRESEARKSAVLEVALDCIITADAQGRILEFNPAAELTFGYKRAEVLGMTLAETIIPPSLRDAHGRGMDHFRATGNGPILGQRVELVGMRKGGKEFPIEIAIVPTSGEAEAEFTAYLRDITESKNADAFQRRFLEDVLFSVTDGHLILCHTAIDLPASLEAFGEPIALSREDGLQEFRHLALDAAKGMAEERRYDLITAVSEAAMNTVTHGGGVGTGSVQVGADGLVQIWVEDQGGGIALAALPKATLARGYSTKASLGMGFKLMQQVDRVYMLTGPTGTTVVIEQSRDGVLPSWLS